MPADITKQILVVDDDPVSLDLISHQLEQRGYSVTKAQSARDALEIVNNEEVLIVMTDVEMPEMDGLQLLQEIKRARGIVQVIMVTATEDLEHILIALQNGADDFLLKPLDAERMEEALAVARARIARWQDTMRSLFERAGA